MENWKPLIKETKLELSEKGKAPYFEIWKDGKEYVLYLMLSRSGGTCPILSELDSTPDDKDLFKALDCFFKNPNNKNKFVQTKKDETRWKRILKLIGEKL